MQFILAFIIFFVIINIIGFVFSFLWPLIVALVVVVAILNLLAYRRRKKAMEEFYQDVEHYENQQYGDFFNDGPSRQTSNNDDVIDVEFTESDIDDER